MRPNLFSRLSGLFLMLCGYAAIAQATSIPMTIKENADVGAQGYPVSVVVPLPRGQYQTTTNLGLAEVPSQVEVLERWPQDNSLRHVLVHFQPSVVVHGDAEYHLTDSGSRTLPVKPVQVSSNSNAITVTTGPMRFVVSKKSFNILDQVWLDQNNNGVFENSEKMITSSTSNGGVLTPRSGAGGKQYDTARPDLKIDIEERGPMRAVIRVEALTKFNSTTDHQHGFAVRLYAYAGKPFIKVDYQLQNSSKDVARSWPLYFEDLNLDFALNLQTNPRATFGINGNVFQSPVNQGVYQAQEFHNRFSIYNRSGAALYQSGKLPRDSGAEGLLDVSDNSRGVTAIVRNFWQMWPNGLAVDANNKLSIQLFPEWSSQWYNKQFSPSGLYWLEDMQHVYKEVLLSFHGKRPDNGNLLALAKTFQLPPVAVVPTDWYRQTRATLDMGGLIPDDAYLPTPDDMRKPFYPTVGLDPRDWYDPASPFYGLGWGNFHDPEAGYRSTPCVAGGWPYSEAEFIATGNPSDYFIAESHGMSELNLRPQWMAQYSHAKDWSRLKLTENAYCDGRWRMFEPHTSRLAAPPLPNTGAETPVYGARDDAHGWFYHVAESYFYTANPWVKDWYRFIGEFRRVRLERLDPFPDMATRAVGHSLGHVMQAERVTGNTILLTHFRTHLNRYLRRELDRQYGDQLLDHGRGGFQTGYLMRAVVNYLEEVRGKDWQAYAEGFNYLSGLVEWNYHYGNFPYYFDVRNGGKGVSNGTAQTMIDPQAWYYWHTGKRQYLEQINAYFATGLNGGEKPYVTDQQWSGDFIARYYLSVKDKVRADSTPPSKISNLSATRNNGVMTLNWTAPSGASRYHIVWSTRPIVENRSNQPDVTNWWAAEVVAPNLAPVTGQPQSVSIKVSNAAKVYAAIFSFDQDDNMSTMSNLVETRR